MRHRLFIVFAVLSLVLCVMTVALWVQSYWVADRVHFQYRHWEGLLLTDSGLVLESSSGGLRVTTSSAEHQCADTNEMTHRRSYDSEHFGRSWGRASSAGYPRGRRVYSQDAGLDWRLGLGCGQLVSPASKEYGPAHTRWIIVPHAAVALPLACLPFLWWRRCHGRRQRKWRQDRGLCPYCGYDLRASKGRCPECGMAIPAKGP
jgi:hypothetical protein